MTKQIRKRRMRRGRLGNLAGAFLSLAIASTTLGIAANSLKKAGLLNRSYKKKKKSKINSQKESKGSEKQDEMPDYETLNLVETI
jgi:hypothetical protein